MNWEMIGAVGEILGAAAVIATLAYLSRQIRSSTQATRRAAMQEVLDQTGYFLDLLGSTPQIAATWAQGLAGDNRALNSRSSFESTPTAGQCFSTESTTWPWPASLIHGSLNRTGVCGET